MVKIENIGEYLINHEIKPSYQRIRIFEYLVKNKNHPTVDLIYKSLVDDIPTLSRTTVYNTLKLFMDKGIVLVLNIDDKEARFDADTSLHGHFKCKDCGIVTDFHFESKDLNFNILNNFKIEDTHIYLKGTCNTCIK